MRIAAAALLAVGCGLWPQDDFTGRRLGDGVAPWQEVGAIELCLGATRLGPEGSAPAGLCQLDGAPPGAACAAEAECRSREGCVCGRCVVARCLTEKDCGEGRVCRDDRCQVACSGGAACAAGETCSAGVCRQGCAGDVECQGGELCVTEGLERRCAAVPCADEAGCRTTETCRLQSEPHALDEPSVLVEAGGYTMWLEIDGAVWRARSAGIDDGRRFRLDPEGPVVPAALAPSVVHGPAGYELWVETPGGLARGTSDDGVTFGALDPREAGDLHAPAAALLPEGRVVLLAGSAGGIVEVGGVRALAPGEVSDPLFWRELSGLSSPHVLVEDGLVRLWFAGFGVESATAEELGRLTEPPPNDSIGYAAAASADAAFTVWPFNPVFQRTVAFIDKAEERAPAVVRVPGQPRYLLYFVGADGVRLARNPPALP